MADWSNMSQDFCLRTFWLEDEFDWSELDVASLMFDSTGQRGIVCFTWQRERISSDVQTRAAMEMYIERYSKSYDPQIYSGCFLKRLSNLEESGVNIFG